MTSLLRKLRWLMRRRGKEAELQDELQFHLEEEAGERQAQGLTGEEARRAARRELGNVALVQEDTRAVWIGSVVTLVTAAILAGYLPARNASRIDPMIALRHE